MEYFSVSRINTFMRCPMQFMYRYLEKFIIPPNAAMAEGSAVHAGIEKYWSKISRHEEVVREEIIETSRDDIVTRFEEEVEYDKEVEVCESIDRVVRGTETFLDDGVKEGWFPLCEPEKQIKCDIGGRMFLGYLDLAVLDRADNEMIVDTKTSGRKKSQADVNGSLQLQLYSYAESIDTVALHTIVITKTKNYPQHLIADVDDEVWDSMIQRFSRIADTIEHCMETGVFTPCSPDHWACSQKWCGFYSPRPGFEGCPYGEPARCRPRSLTHLKEENNDKERL